MAQIHPHTNATYRIVQRSDKSFGAEVSIPGMLPTMISGFATKALAEAWIAKHKQEIEDYPLDRGWRGRAKKQAD